MSGVLHCSLAFLGQFLRLAVMEKSPNMPLSRIRNFAIIAHIDHGKSTLADRLIQICGGLELREMKEQVLDSLEIERERGITIKAQTARLAYKAQDGLVYQLNLIDTPGHVDFSYEVSRALAACEGSLLVVDAAQGVEAQTLANVYKALDQNHEIVPVINKVDLPSADVPRVQQQIEDVIGLDAHDAVLISAKTGLGIDAVLEALVTRLPPPVGDENAPLQALVIDSWYDAYVGVVALVRVKQGVVRKGQKLRFMGSGAVQIADDIGFFTPKAVSTGVLYPGEVGFVTAGIKSLRDCRVGDTLTDDKAPAASMLPGFEAVLPVVFCGLYPVDSGDFEKLRESLDKLTLNDSSLIYEPYNSIALGFGFRCGFLGLLHMEIVQERLEREFNLDLIATAPSVVYHAYLNDGSMMEIRNPADLPDSNRLERLEEPWIKATIFCLSEQLGGVLTLCTERRGVQVDLTYVGNRAMAVYRLPLAEVVFDFHDRLKSLSRGYASFDYALDGYAASELVRVSILVNGEPLDALAMITHRSTSEHRGRALCAKLKDVIPAQMFPIALQAAIGGRIIARETIKALRKDVLAKCYGGDISRKRKLLDKQKEGKKRMRQVGRVEIPQDAFIAALKLDS